MTLIVETGTNVPGAESYVSVADCAAYATARGFTFTADAAGEAALRRATAYIDTTYQSRFPGLRTYRRQQSLEWPRSGAFYPAPQNDVATCYVPSFTGYDASIYGIDAIGVNVIPPEIVNACCLAAVREQEAPNSLLPDLERGGQVLSYRAGTVQVRYANGASPNTVFQAIEAALAPLIGRANGLTARAVRG